MIQNYRNMLSLLAVIIFTVSTVFSGTTGKISGTVKDSESGEGLIGCNVIIDNTQLGASVNLDGSFFIMGIAPGKYSVKATMIGYQTLRISDVYVRADLTTPLEFELSPEVLKSGTIVEVIAKRETIVKDLTATAAIVTAEQISAMPVTDVGEIIDLQAGMVDGHMRGGRSGEIAYWIDGIPVTDVYDGGQLVEVSKDLIQELQVISGAFNAEYGQAMSGIVNITTKTGYRKWGGQITTYAGDYLSGHSDIYSGLEDVNPLTIKNVEISLHGPVIKDKLDISLTHRNVYWQGWLNGEHQFNPWAVSLPSSAGLYTLGTNSAVDTLLANMTVDIPAQGELTDGEYTSLKDSLLGAQFDDIHDNHANSVGDGSIVPMQWNRRLYTHARINYQIIPLMNISIQGSYTDYKWQDYERDYRLNPYGNLTKYTINSNFFVKLTHALSNRTFYSLGASTASKKYFQNNADDYFIYQELFDVRVDSYSFHVGGSNNGRFARKSLTNLIKFDMTHQRGTSHQIKTGFEYRQHTLTMQDSSLQPPANKTSINLITDSGIMENPRIFDQSTIHNSSYKHNPNEISGYLQDKIELSELIINLGVRVDYFEPDGTVLADPSDPSIYAPLKVENIYVDVNGDGIYGDSGDREKTVEERAKYWYTPASEKIQVSPRFGASFPITDKGVIHVSYGHFLQLPRFEMLYRNPDYDLDSGTGNIGWVGNTDLKPEKTISGEIGINQEVMDGLSFEVTAYFRDIRNLVGTNAAQIELFGGSAYYNKVENGDFAHIKGAVLALNYYSPSGITANLDYTFQVAEGTASDAEEARNAVNDGVEPGIYIRPLNWDQRHTVNLSLAYRASNWGTSMIGNYGSGLPYTPNLAAENTLLTNAATKPILLSADLNAYYNVEVMGQNSQFFLRIQNLFDHLNQTNVYAKSGLATFTPDQKQVEGLNLGEYVNTVEEWFRDETYYSEPRRIEFGLVLSF